MDYSSSCSDVSSDGLNVDTSNNLNDVFFDDTDGIDMDVDEGDAISVKSIPGEAQDYFEGDVAGLANVSSLLDSESDHGEDLASLSSLFGSDSDIVVLTSETQDVLEENEEELASIPSLFGSDRDYVALNAEIEDILEGIEEELANVPSLFGSDRDYVALRAEIADILEGIDEELASASDIESLNDETQVVLEGNEDDFASVTSLLASEVSSGSVEVIDLEDDDEAMVDVDQVSNSHSQLSALQDVQENINLLTAAELPPVSVASSDSSTQAVLDDHFEAGELRRNREQFFQSAPVSAVSTDSPTPLTPLQEYNFRITIDQIRLRELRREAAEMEALLDEQESTVDQCTGYGILQGNLDFIRDIEGVLPKLPSFQLTFNWLTNSENNFNLFI